MEKKTIMVVDDSAVIRKFIAITLSNKGFEILNACDGMEALEKLPNEDIDLIITDLNMPNVDGFELIKTVRSNEEFKSTPIIVLSNLSATEEIEKALKFGANSFLAKPFEKEAIINEVSKYLN
jgi:two-component system chemotaxis response regulator CheY